MAPSDASVVIPACNEEEHIGSLLASLCEARRAVPLRIIVACNGSTDATERIARSFEEVEVLVLTSPSKAAALNAGDEAAGDAFPRLYVDGDVRVDADSIRALVAALQVEGVRAVGPRVAYGLERSPWLVRSFIRTTERLPFNVFWHASHLQGRGIYGTNRAGRARFDSFPDIRSDDGFFDLAYTDNERLVVHAAVVRLECPTSTRELLRNQTRVLEGYRELMAWMREHAPGRPDRFVGPQGKGWRDLDLWRRSPIVTELWHGATATDAVGYVILEVLSRANSLARRALRKEIPWR